MEDLFKFDKSTLTSTKEKGKAKAIKKERAKKLRQTKRDENFETIINECGGFPNSNEYVAIKTNGTSDCGSIFSTIIKKFGKIDEMFLATWTISKQNINRIKEAIELKELDNLTMVFSSTLKQANPALYSNLMLNLKEFENIKLKEINSHAKTFSVKCGNDYLTVTGSANWSENPRIENFLILNDINLYNHHKEWMSELAEIK